MSDETVGFRFYFSESFFCSKVAFRIETGVEAITT